MAHLERNAIRDSDKARLNDSFVLTFDIDWAPDWAIDDCLSICRNHGVSAAFFATHDTAILQDIAGSDSFDLGVHPNFLPGSSHGPSVAQVMEYCLTLVPGATLMRTHGLYGSYGLFREIKREFPQISADCSIFLPGVANLQPFPLYFHDCTAPLIRVPLWLSDMAASATPGFSWDMDVTSMPGLKVLNFHPIHVALNSRSPASYSVMKARLSTTPLSEVSRRDAAPFVNSEAGVRTFLEGILRKSPGRFTARLPDVLANHFSNVEGVND